MASRIFTHRLVARSARRHHAVGSSGTTTTHVRIARQIHALPTRTPQAACSCKYQCRSFSASKGDDGGGGSTNSPPESQYVHPLSQIVLEHLQASPSAAAFVTQSGLGQSLSIHDDGTFTLQFPNDGGKIWTSFDPEEKKHWLTVHKGELVGRYMLQDNKKPAWHSDRRSVPEKVQDAVDEMIKRLQK